MLSRDELAAAAGQILTSATLTDRADRPGYRGRPDPSRFLRKGAWLTRKRYGRGVATVLLVSVVAVNLVTIAADLQAGAAGLGLLAGVDFRWLVAPLGLALAGLLVAGRYGQVVAVLRYLMLWWRPSARRRLSRAGWAMWSRV